MGKSMGDRIFIGAIVGVACILAVEPTANAIPNMSALQAYLDGVTTGPTAGSSSVNLSTDYVSDQADSYWQIGASGGSFSTVVVELTAGYADNLLFGVFDAASPANRLQLFGGSAAAGTKTAMSVNSSGAVTIIEDFGGANILRTGAFAGSSFGFYLDSSFYAPSGGLFFSDTALNTDGYDHMRAYQGVGDVIEISGQLPGPWSANEFILAWEDLVGGGDEDMDDFVVLVESVSPVPDAGSTLMLLGIGMLGLGLIRRTKS